MGPLVMNSFIFCLSENATIIIKRYFYWEQISRLAEYWRYSTIFYLLWLLLRSQMKVCHSCKDNLSFSLWLLLRFSHCLWFSVVSLCRASFLYLSYLVFITLVSVTCVSLLLGSVSNIVCVQFFSFLSFRDFWLNKYMSEIFTLSSLFSYSFIFFIFFCLIYILEIPSDLSLSSPTFSSAVSNLLSAEFLISIALFFGSIDLIWFFLTSAGSFFYKQKFSSLFYIFEKIANIAVV